MTDGVTLTFDPAALDRSVDRAIRRYLAAGTAAIAETTRRLEKRLEDVTRSAVPGKLWRAWGSESYPRRGPARNPTGVVFLNGGKRTRGAITFWSEPGSVRAKSGQYLAIPLPAAGTRGRSRDLTPGDWERLNGQRLRFVYRQGRASLLVAVGGALNARTGSYRKLTAGARGRIAQGRGGANPLANAIIPIFVLIPMVRQRNAFAIEPIVRQAEGDLVEAFLRRTGAVG